MRDFSEYEKSIIKNHLITGAGITGMLSNDFLTKGKLIISISSKEGIVRQKFEYLSSELSVETARDELVNLVELLLYLEEEGCLRKYPPTSINIDDMNEEVSFSFGDTWSSQSQKFLLHEKAFYLGSFLKEYRDYIFRVTEPLKNLAENDFKSAEEIRHTQILMQARRANKITLAIAIVTVFFSMLSTGFQVKSLQKGERTTDELTKALSKLSTDSLQIEIMNAKVQEKLRYDSLKINILTRDLSVIKKQLDSISSVVNKLSKPKPQVKQGV